MSESRLVVAVSGGVDSVVLLDKLAKSSDNELVIAHFDHGIRPDSVEDAQFVKELAAKYSLQFEMKREELGANASEAVARQRRYQFLRRVSDKYQARVVTAHHLNDIAETIAINLVRGTGWRGAAVLDSDNIERPLLGMFKSEIYQYAKQKQLEWRDDSTNHSDRYLRNRLRRKLDNDDLVLQLAALRAKQIDLKNQIDQAVYGLPLSPPFSRYFFIMLDNRSAQECLRHVTGRRLTRPQLRASLLAIKTFPKLSQYQAGSGVVFSFTSRHFTARLL